MMPPTDNPGVRLPPPFLYLIAILLGVLINQRWPLPVEHSATVITIGVVCVLAWLALMITSVDRKSVV